MRLFYFITIGMYAGLFAENPALCMIGASLSVLGLLYQE